MAEVKTKQTKKTTTDQSATAITAQMIGLSERHEVNPTEFAQWVRALRQNWRQGTVHAKTRAEVCLSNRKPFKQKGTGRARAGTFRSPLWRKGGVIFPPQPRTRQLSIAQSTKVRVLNALLWQFIDNNRVHQITFESEQDRPRTAQAFKALKGIGLHDQKVTLLVVNDDSLTHASFANLPNVQLLLLDQANCYDLASAQHIVVLQKDVPAFKETVTRWQ